MEIKGLPSPMFDVGNLSTEQKADAGLMFATDQNLMPQVDVGVDTTSLSSGLDFLSGNLDTIGTFASMIGGLMSNREDRKYRKKVYTEEKRRVAREEQRQDDFDAAMDKAYM